MIRTSFRQRNRRGATLLVALMAWIGHAMADPTALTQLRNEPKFRATTWYTGPDTPEDGPVLILLVNRTIDDILALPSPYDAGRLRNRLKRLIADVDPFATEDRDQMYRYVVRIWRAAGFAEESKLFQVSDDRVLEEMR
jgi:hypothetical protein